MERIKKLNSFKYMLWLTVPIFIELLLQLVVGYSDQIMMSKYQDAVNGITNSNTVINMIINVFVIFAASAIILITQYKGAQDGVKERKVYSNAFFFNLIASLVFSLLIVLLCRYYLRWLRVPDSAYRDAYYYTLITGGLIFFQAMSSTMSAFLKANSFMKESMIINMIVNVINIVGNLVLITLFSRIDLPILGVAISSSVSRIIGFILMSIVYVKKVGVGLSFKSFVGDFRVGVLKLVRIGAPSGGEAISYNSSQIVIQLCANQVVAINCGNVGLGNIKAYASMFAMVTYMFTSAVSQAMQVVIGELLGAGRTKDTNKKVMQTLLISVVTSTSIAVIFFLISNYAFRIFGVTDPSLLRVAKGVMFVEIFLELGRAFNVVFVRALQTTGDIMFPTISAVFFCWAVAVVGSFLFGIILGLGIVGIWIAMALDECIRAVIFLFRWKSGKWMSKSVT